MYITIFRLAIITLSSLGIWGVGGISFSHWTGEASCPMIGSLPACYIILFAYGLILLSVLFTFEKTLTVFLIGWIPVIILALIGIGGEITSTLACPPSEIGIPKCYFSALLSIVIGCLYWYFYKQKKLMMKNRV